MSTDPVQDASEHYARLEAKQAAQDAAEFAASADYLALCDKGDANALAAFAHQVTDWDAAPLPYIVNGQNARPMRAQALHEVLADSLDLGDGPSTSELMQLLLNTSLGGTDVQAQATSLLHRMATTWASNNVTLGG